MSTTASPARAKKMSFGAACGYQRIQSQRIMNKVYEYHSRVSSRAKPALTGVIGRAAKELAKNIKLSGNVKTVRPVHIANALAATPMFSRISRAGVIAETVPGVTLTAGDLFLLLSKEQQSRQISKLQKELMEEDAEDDNEDVDESSSEDEGSDIADE